MNHKLYLTTTALILLAAAGRADELSEKGRDIFKKNQHAVVSVQVILKVTGGRGAANETKEDLTGTVIDPSGLTVMALSSVDPVELMRRVSDEYNKVETEVSDVKLLLDDGTEVPSEIVLRDKDLDLAFVRPKTKASTPMAAVDLSKSTPVELLEPIVSLNRLNRAAGRAYSAAIERIDAVIQKPRTFYIPSSGSLGTPAFSLNGSLVGIFVMRAVSGGEVTARNRNDNMTVILLPAGDILKGAQQAPEAKGETEKPTEKPATTNSTTEKKDGK